MKLEADELCTSMVAYPKNSPERFALVLGNTETDTKMYFFITRDMVHDLVGNLCDMVGFDA